jgi:hypothetical protein
MLIILKIYLFEGLLAGLGHVNFVNFTSCLFIEISLILLIKENGNIVF